MRKLIILGLVLLAPCLWGQTLGEYVVQGKEKIASAVSSWDKDKMLSARAHFERVLALGEKEWLLNYYIAYCDYRLATYALSEEDKKSTMGFINDGLARLKRSIQQNSEFAESYALMSSLYGLKINLRPWAGFLYGPRSGRYLATALALGPSNPRVHYIQGMSSFHTPERFGGGKKKAKSVLEEAIMLFSSEDVSPLMPDWGYSEAYGWLGLCELDLGDTTSAKLHFDKALDIDPENNWVKYRLLPGLDSNESP
ncbi:MAG: hypothetical protein KAU50_01760 [Candidatus Marinimicrobia bacterium]|nr:hypothetical protein [Candidatus Neomarinimicrobiota bacterium]